MKIASALSTTALLAFTCSFVSAQGGSVSFWTDEAAFDAQYPNLTSEDFEDTDMPDGQAWECGWYVVEATGDFFFIDEGDIEPGFVIECDRFSFPSLRSVGAGALGNPSKMISTYPSTTGPLEIELPSGDVTAFGFDLFLLEGSDTTVDVVVYDVNGNELGSTTSAADATGVFLGISSSTPIGRVTVDSPDVEGVDNLRRNGRYFVASVWPRDPELDEGWGFLFAGGDNGSIGYVVITSVNSIPVFSIYYADLFNETGVTGGFFGGHQGPAWVGTTVGWTCFAYDGVDIKFTNETLVEL